MDFLTATQAGTPDVEIPKVAFDGGSVPTPLCIVVVAREAQEKKTTVRRMEITVNLITWLKAADAGAASVDTQTTREDAGEIVRGLEDRLRDDAAWNTFIAGVAAGENAARLQGWSIVCRRFEGVGSPMREAETRKLTYPIKLRYSLAVSRGV
ncbi:MAG TPA: hypothetical protein PK490_12210 [Prosthecobacter sp.]|nr:hypothetical protein [Prosthecobacter sp.]HRK15050.1 hypothetical protein [Prosthecobacter sp.]